MRVTMVKNKVGFPWRTAEFNLIYESGVDKESDTIEFGLQAGIIKREGNSIIYKDIKLGVGKDKAKDTLTQNVELHSEIRNACIKIMPDVIGNVADQTNEKESKKGD